ncbi:MAG: hypothetical protein WA421_08160 [Nitrososphaeraceae archaeon]
MCNESLSRRFGGEESPIMVGNTLISDPGTRFDMVLTNLIALP